MNDLTGKKFGRLTVVALTDKRYHNHIVWECRCECGKPVFVSGNKLKAGDVTSCGCARVGVNLKDITGQRFGRLTAIQRTDKHVGNSVVWKCECDCGNTAEVASAALANGSTRSCGCLASEVHRESFEAAREKYAEKNLQDGTNLSQLGGKKTIRNTSGTVGISYDRSVGLWKAYITFQGKRHYLGSAKTKEELIELRKEAEEEIHLAYLKSKTE